MPSLIFGISCPHCGEGHLLSSLGVKPIIEDVDHPMEPTLTMEEEEEEVLDYDGDVLTVSALHVTCAFCEGTFELELVTTKPEERSTAHDHRPPLVVIDTLDPD